MAIPQTDFTSFRMDALKYRTIPVIRRYFSDMLTPIQAMQSLKEQASFLLESNDPQSPWSNFSFIGLDPYFVLTEDQGRFIMNDLSKRESEYSESFQEAFDKLIDRVRPKQLSDLSVPFWGGGVGYMAYDAVSHIEDIEIDRSPDGKLIHFLFCRTIVVFDHHQKELILIEHVRINGEEDENGIERKYHTALKSMEAIYQKVHTTLNTSFPIELQKFEQEIDFEQFQSNYTKPTFKSDVEKIKEYIKAGDIFQCVLSQRWEVETEVTGFDLYRILRIINPSPYQYYLRYEDFEIVGSSPERLVQVLDGEVEIHPIAGTRRRGKSKEEDEGLAEELLADDKELAEHYMLVDLARNDVGRVSRFGTVHTPELVKIGLFSHVMHIISKVRGTLAEEKTPIDALIASFPAGTVSGAPKVRAMEIIQELEPSQRGVYAGGIAYLGYDGNIDSCIAIRTMIVKDQKVFIQAGAGIVADSVPEKEWEETQNKARALMHVIKTAESTFLKGAFSNV